MGGLDSLAEMTQSLIGEIQGRAVQSLKGMQDAKALAAQKTAEERALNQALNATSSTSAHDADDGTGLRSVGQGSRADSHGPEPERKISMKRQRLR